jgi:hypothetical protein
VSTEFFVPAVEGGEGTPLNSNSRRCDIVPSDGWERDRSAFQTNHVFQACHISNYVSFKIHSSAQQQGQVLRLFQKSFKPRNYELGSANHISGYIY